MSLIIHSKRLLLEIFSELRRQVWEGLLLKPAVTFIVVANQIDVYQIIARSDLHCGGIDAKFYHSSFPVRRG